MKKLIGILSIGITLMLSSCAEDPAVYKQIVKNNTDETITFTAESETCHNTYTLKPGEEVTTHDAQVVNAPKDCTDHKYTVSTPNEHITDISNIANWDYQKGNKTVTCRFTFEKR